MLRALYGAVGVLAAPLSSTGNKLVVDSGLDALIRNAMVLGDWAYLAITDGRNIEIIKLYAPDSNGIRIERGKDNTSRNTFPAGAKVYYTLTAAEIADRFVPAPLTLYRENGIELDGLTVGYRVPSIYSIGGTKAIVHDEEITLARDEQAYGCCDGNNDPAPIPSLPIYLTSRPYAIEETDAIQAGPLDVLRGQTIERVREDLIAVSITVLDGNLWGGLKTHTQTPEDLIQVSLTLLEGDLWGGLVTTANDDDICRTRLDILQGDLWGALVTYSHPSDYELDHIRTGLTVMSGTLT